MGSTPPSTTITTTTSSSSSSSSRLSFLSLPPEIRMQIYTHALPPTRLSARPILDPEYLLTSTPSIPTTIPPLLFTSKQIHHESSPLFYRLATLALAPTQLSPTDTRPTSAFFAQHDLDHSFCPPRYLRMIGNVHVYGDQGWVVDRRCFQALFSWVVMRTGAGKVYLSRRTVQQGRHGDGELVCLDGVVWPPPSLSLSPVAEREEEEEGGEKERVVDVYARNVSGRLKFWKGALASRVKPLPDVLVYRPGVGGGGLCREQGWRLEGGDGDGEVVVAEMEEVQKWEMERFAKEELGDVCLRQAHVDGYLWLFKTIRIRGKGVLVEKAAAAAAAGEGG